MVATACAATLMAAPVQAQVQPQVKSALPITRSLKPIGPLAGTNRVKVGIQLPLRNQDQLKQFVKEVSDPGSTNYRKYLKPWEFTERFGPTQEDYDVLKGFASRHGLTVRRESAGRMLLGVEGSAADIEKAFQVKLLEYQHPKEARTFRMPDREPTLDVAVPVLGVLGLENYRKAKPSGLHSVARSFAKSNDGSAPDASGAFIGFDIRQAYLPNPVPSTGGPALDGAGQSVGILEFDGFNPSDIQLYATLAGLPGSWSGKIFVNSEDPSPNPPGGANLEVALDIEMVMAMAPGLNKIVVYEGDPAGEFSDYMAELDAMVAGYVVGPGGRIIDNNCHVLSSSWGFFPDYTDPSNPVPAPSSYDPYFQQMVAQGQTFCQASGDSGPSDGSPGGFYPPQVPADDTNVMSVGGTQLTTTGTATMNSAREWHTATMLSNGKVLVAGGFGPPYGYTGQTTAELYDPATGIWTLTGSMNYARGAHTATVLPNGKVLVVGGDSGSGEIGTAELYDPTSGTWSVTGSLGTAREYHTATLLPNGKVLVAGGCNNGFITFASAELYDPSTGTWAPTGSLNESRTLYTATLLSNGKVLAAAGFTWALPGVGGTINTAELYDPSTGTWSATSPLGQARNGFTATLLLDGQVLAAGGGGDSYTPITSTELYDPSSGTWSATGSLNNPHAFHTAARLADGSVLVASGSDASGAPGPTAEVYAAGTWTTTGSMATARYYHTATLLPTGKVLVAGGDTDSQCLASAELYDPSTPVDYYDQNTDTQYWITLGGTWGPTGSSWSSETTWNYFNLFSTGGGWSYIFPQPSWQFGISGAFPGVRNYPDVSLLGFNLFVIDSTIVGVGDGFTAISGQPAEVQGTSAAAPLWAGFCALANQYSASQGLGYIGFVNPTLYSAGKGTAYSSYFHDITTGFTECDPPYGNGIRFNASTGWDLCSGWGTPTGINMIYKLVYPSLYP
jgi:subtilase family serine protease